MFIPHYVSCVRCHVAPVTCHLSHVNCHLSHVKCHLSPVTCQKCFYIFFYYKKNKYISLKKNWTKWWSQSVEGLLSTGPTPSSSRGHCTVPCGYLRCEFSYYWLGILNNKSNCPSRLRNGIYSVELNCTVLHLSPQTV